MLGKSCVTALRIPVLLFGELRFEAPRVLQADGGSIDIEVLHSKAT